MNELSEKEFWLYKNAIRVEALSMALAALDNSVDLDAAKSMVKQIRDSYALASSPFVKDESTDHLL
jgi:hypothetical protein